MSEKYIVLVRTDDGEDIEHYNEEFDTHDAAETCIESWQKWHERQSTYTVFSYSLYRSVLMREG